MAETTENKGTPDEKVLFDKAAGNGSLGAGIKVTRTRGPAPDPDPEPCDDCAPAGKATKAQFGLGLVITAVAGALAYIGLDLLTGGRVSGRGRPWPELDDDQ